MQVVGEKKWPPPPPSLLSHDIFIMTLSGLSLKSRTRTRFLDTDQQSHGLIEKDLNLNAICELEV